MKFFQFFKKYPLVEFTDEEKKKTRITALVFSLPTFAGMLITGFTKGLTCVTIIPFFITFFSLMTIWGYLEEEFKVGPFAILRKSNSHRFLEMMVGWGIMAVSIALALTCYIDLISFFSGPVQRY
ncbi:MAG: hypothetical protein ACLFQV_01060 [Vulcanimicrobiota bacterium]